MNILNTKFKKRERKLWTYTFANNAKEQIDYILMNKKLYNSASNCIAYSSLEGVSSDHRIVTAKICLSLCRKMTQSTETEHYDRSMFNNRDIIDKYTITLRKKFDALQGISETLTLNDEYKNFVNARIEAAAECISVKMRTKQSSLGDINS